MMPTLYLAKSIHLLAVELPDAFDYVLDLLGSDVREHRDGDDFLAHPLRDWKHSLLVAVHLLVYRLKVDRYLVVQAHADALAIEERLEFVSPRGPKRVEVVNGRDIFIWLRGEH